MDVPEIDALRRMQADNALANRLDQLAKRREEHGGEHLSATPERRADRQAQKEARSRKKAARKQSRR